MTMPKINTTQAHEFAIAIISDISAYIENHKAEYLAYLSATGQADDRYQCDNKAAEHMGEIAV